jgi:hypothetical protein
VGEPFAPSWAGCGGYGVKGQCNTMPTWDGLVYFPHPRTLYRAFACDDHRAGLEVARPLDDDGRAELDRRRERLRLVLVEKQPYEREPPLAAGRDAVERLAHARGYAERHEVEGWWVRPDESPDG